MARRGNNIYKRKDGRWEGRLYFGKKYKSVYAKSYSEAREKLYKLRSKMESEAVRCGMSFEALSEVWLKDIACKVKRSSYYCYRTKLDKHIIPYFKGIAYDDINVGLCEKFISEKLRAGLSAGYISDMVTLLKMISAFSARQHGFENRIADLKPPRTEKNETQILSKSSQKKLCAELCRENTGISLGVMLCLYTGLRIGEICAMQWGDVDFENRLIYVRKTCKRLPVENGRNKTCVKITEPKTKSSVRKIPLPEFIFQILQKRRSAPEHFILSGTEKCREPKFMQYRFKKILQKAKVPSVRFHALRHTFATNCLQTGFDVKTLSEIMGHSNVQTTLNRYVHTSMERKAYCMNLLKEV